VFFDPQSPESFASAIRDLEPPREWKTRSRLARARAGHYSWDRSAEALLGALTDVYEARRAT
jgi:glycosyltransferase involved in cell wall biosynthesis